MSTPFTISYAQNREDIILNGFFPDIKKGFYIDVGAYDPEIDSVTKFFYDKGWNGINVEPQKKLYLNFVKNRKRDLNLNIGVSDKRGVLTLREYAGDGLSTFSRTMKKNYEEKQQGDFTKTYTDYDVKVETLADVFKRAAQHVHFLKVDVEGLEYEVLIKNDWTKYRPELICIESNHIVKDWHEILLNNKYVSVFFDGLNEYFLAKESLKRKEMFSYPEAFLMGPMIIPRNIWGIIDSKQQEIASLAQSIETLTATLNEITDYNRSLEQEKLALTESGKLKDHLIKKQSKEIRRRANPLYLIVVYLKKAKFIVRKYTNKSKSRG